MVCLSFAAERRKNAAYQAIGPGGQRHRLHSENTKVNNGKEYSYWQARYTDPATGLQHAITGSTQKEVAQKLIETLNDINQGSYVAPSKQTLGQWLDVWLDTYVSHSVKPYTEDSYRSTCEVHIKPALGNIKLSSLTTIQIQRFYNQLQTKGLSPKTIKNINGKPAICRSYTRRRYSLWSRTISGDSSPPSGDTDMRRSTRSRFLPDSGREKYWV